VFCYFTPVYLSVHYNSMSGREVLSYRQVWIEKVNYRKKASFGHPSSLLVTMIYLDLSKCFQTKMILAYP